MLGTDLRRGEKYSFASEKLRAQCPHKTWLFRCSEISPYQGMYPWEELSKRGKISVLATLLVGFKFQRILLER